LKRKLKNIEPRKKAYNGDYDLLPFHQNVKNDHILKQRLRTLPSSLTIECSEKYDEFERSRESIVKGKRDLIKD
jgi:hypothetical protein